MKIKENYLLRQVAGTWAVLPLEAEAINFNGMLTLNESGVLLWKALEQGADREKLTEILLAEYDVSEKQAKGDVAEFLETLQKTGCLENME